MSTSWIAACKKCGFEESFGTPRTTDGAPGEKSMALSRANSPCPKCKSVSRQLKTSTGVAVS